MCGYVEVQTTIDEWTSTCVHVRVRVREFGGAGECVGACAGYVDVCMRVCVYVCRWGGVGGEGGSSDTFAMGIFRGYFPWVFVVGIFRGYFP